MAFRKTKRAKQYAQMREAKERKRLASLAPDYPMELPELRKVIITINYDGDKPSINTMRLYKTGRIDQYRAVANGKLWRERIGLSGVLAGIRKSMPPVRAI